MRRKLLIFSAKVAVGLLAVAGLLLLGLHAVQADQSGWISSGNPTLKKLIDLPANTSPGISNRDCTKLTYQSPDPITGLLSNKSDCFVNTLVGQMGAAGTPLTFNDSSLGLNIQGYGNYLPQPIPNQQMVAALTPAPLVGSYMHFYQDITKHLTANYTSGLDPWQTGYTVNASPDFSLRDKNGTLMAVNNTNTLSYSSNGAWFVVDDPYHGFIRVNLATFDILPFAASLNNNGDLSSPVALTAISDDGRFAAVASDSFFYFRIYDLSTCTGTATNDYSQPLTCQYRDYWPFMSSQLSNFRAIYKIRFTNDDNISVTATYNSQGPSTYSAATLTLTAPGKLAHGLDYLAIGDSYVSGEGEFVYKDGTDMPTNLCHLSNLSYPFSIGAGLYNGYQSIACSGAKTKDITGEGFKNYNTDRNGAQWGGKGSSSFDTEIYTGFLPGYRTQLSFIQEYQPQVVTLSIGGNDIGFGDIVASCAVPLLSSVPGVINSSTCYNTYDERLQLIESIGTSFGTLQTTYRDIVKADPGVRLYVTGYPQVVVNGDCGDNVRMNGDEIQFAQQLVAYLDWTIERAATSVGVRYVDVQQAFAGHRLCETDGANVAINGVTKGNDNKVLLWKLIGRESFHPNVLGHQLLGQVVLQKTNNLTQAMPAPDPSITRPQPSDMLAQALLNNRQYTGNPAPQVALSGSFVDDFIIRNSNTPLVVDGVQNGLKPNSTFQISLHSDPVSLGTITSDADGNLNAQIEIPANTDPGFHTITLSGLNMSGETIQIYETVFVAASATDFNGDGTPDNTNQCGLIPLSGHDVDQDGIDDACDPQISSPPANPYPYAASLTGNTIVITKP